MIPNYQIPEDVFCQANECSHNKSCIKQGVCGSKKMCAAASSNGVVILETRISELCNYRKEIAFGIQICKCPVRLYLFKTYKI